MAINIGRAAFFWLKIENLAGYSIRAVAMPSGTGASHPFGYDNDDRSIDVENTLGSLWLNVYHDGVEAPVAHAVFAATPASVKCDTIDVDEDHRRKGIATALYDIAEQVFGVGATPSDVLSDEAAAFWARRR